MKNIAIITGASGGLGKEFISRLISEVDELWAVGRNVSKLEALKVEMVHRAKKSSRSRWTYLI